MNLPRIEPFEGMVAIGTRGDHGLNPRIGPSFDIALGCFAIIRAISHVVGSSTATRFVFSHDTEIDTGILEKVNRSCQHLP